MSFYLESKLKSDCFNCTACANICPVNCITMKVDKNDGYVYPNIDYNKCIKCGKCKNVCINVNNDKLQGTIRKSYVLYNKNNEVRCKSSSGGISQILMEYVIEKNGVIYGAKYNEKLVVVHDRATTIEECEKFRGSKYVRSDILGIYEKVKNDLQNDKLVLFTGTPCQIAGLKAVINEKLQNNLILCEIMCDSVASPIVFEKFKDEVEKKYESKITNINFRSKVNGAHNKTMEINFENRKKIDMMINKSNLYSEYMQIFGCGLSAPFSCSKCKFEYIDRRTSDFTIGDYWGKKEILKDDNRGISFMLVNSEKAERIFDTYIKEKVNYEEVTIMDALNNNHLKNKEVILNKDKFMNDLPNLSFEELSKKYVRKYMWRTKLGKLIPKDLKEKIKKIIIKR